MNRTYTREQIAGSFELWQEYVDTFGTMTRAEFEALSHADRMDIMDMVERAFGVVLPAA